MRPFDELLRLHADHDPLVRRYALAQAEHVRADLEGAELVELLAGAAAGPDPRLAAQAARSLRRVLPQYYDRKYNQRQATSTSTTGTWTEYNIDRAEIEKLKRLGRAQSIDFGTVDVPRTTASALHLLTPCAAAAARQLASTEPDLRQVALRTLGQLNVPQALDALAPAVEDDALAVSAAAALSDLGSGRALDALLKALPRHRGKPWFEDVVVELRGFPIERAQHALLEELGTTENRVKAAVAHALASFPLPGTEAALVDLLREADDQTRLYAVDSLARVGGAGAVEPLGRLFGSSRNEHVREAAMRALGATGTPASQELVSNGLKASEPRVRAQALETLVRLRIPDQQLFNLAFPLVQDENPLVSSYAVLALAPIDSAVALQKVFAFLRQSDVYARAQGVYCLGYVQSQSALELLKQITQRDASELVAVQATKALAKYRADEAVPLLLGLLQHPQAAVRRTSARILGQFSEPGNLAIFNKVQICLKTEFDATVKVALVETWARVAEPSQHLVMAKLLEDRSPLVVAAVLEGLDLLGNIDSVAKVEAFVGNPAPDVKARAALALWNQGEVKVVERLAAEIGGEARAPALGAMRAAFEIGLALKRLAAPAKYPLLLSELQDNLKSRGFVEFEQRWTNSQLTPAARPARQDSRGFDFTARAVAVEPASFNLDLPGLDNPIEGLDEALAAHKAASGLPDRSGEGPASAAAAPITAQPSVREVALEEALRLFLNDPAKALSAVERLEGEWDDPAVRFLHAKILLKLRRTEEAERVLTSLAAESADVVNPLLILVGLCQQRKASADMAEHFTRAVSSSLELLREQVDVTLEILRKGDLDAVSKCIRELKQQLPALDSVHKRTGVLYLRAGDANAAFLQLLLAHVADPMDGEVTVRLARAAHRSGRQDIARELCRGLLRNASLAEAVRTEVRELLEKLG